MRSGFVLVAAAAALTAMSATGAQAEEWCGFRTHTKSIIECGYSSNTECQNAIGKDGMCFLDPEFAFDVKRAATLIAARLTAERG